MICTKCQQDKAKTEFYVNRKTGKLFARCKSCVLESNKVWKTENSEHYKKWAQEYGQKNREQINKNQRRWKDRNPGKAKQQAREWYRNNLEHARLKNRECEKRIKDAAFNVYGGYICACCGETEEFFLSIDHINNDGAQHRREIGGTRFTGGGKKLYVWLKKNGYPEGFQVLCRNCNWGKHANGGTCPHQNKTEPSTTIPKGSRPQANGDRSAKPSFSM